MACFYNDAVTCRTRDCLFCGWNPDVTEKRKGLIRIDARKALRGAKELAERRNDREYTEKASKRKRPVRAINDANGIVREFDAIGECAAALAIDPKSIWTVLNGYQKTSKGWRFEDVKAQKEARI